jgi:hypothetical protein
MPRWYAGRECWGSQETIVAQVSALMRNHNLGGVVPLMRFEKRGRQRGGRFHMFLAIESDTPGELPPALEPWREYSLFRELIRDPSGTLHVFSAEEIKSMTFGAEIGVEEYARRLRVRLAEPPEWADPFPADDKVPDAALDVMLDRSQRFDRLLTWITVTGGGGRAALLAACRALGLAAGGTEVGRILRRLRLLGHVESSPDGERWSATPPVLAEVTAPSPERAFVLCGERDRRLLAALHALSDVEETPQPGGAAPARVLVRTTDAEGLAARLRELALSRPPRLARPAARLAELLAAVPGIDPARYVTRRYDPERPEGDAFAPIDFEGAPGLYELWARQDGGAALAGPRHTLLYDTRGRWLRGDWYGLRCLAHAQAGGRCPAHYEFFAARLLIPYVWRPPELYERALVLASGRLPERRDPWLLYEEIDAGLLAVIAARLGLNLLETAPHV